MIRAGKDI